MKQIMIVKTSSLGDIIQAFDVLNVLHRLHPDASIDWIVEERFVSIVAAHPLVQHAIPFDIKNFKRRWLEKKFWKSLWTALRSLRRQPYDYLFDLQGNCKSGVVTFLCRANLKIGFGRKSVREWPNVLVTHRRFEVARSINIRQQYVKLVQQFFVDQTSNDSQEVRFRIDQQDMDRLQTLLSHPFLQRTVRVMICPGSKWINKQIPLDTLAMFMSKMENALHCSFFLIWGGEEEKMGCIALQYRFPHCSVVVDRLEVPLWQNLMCEVDLVVAIDSSALHLCATTATPTFSIFGPTSPDVFKPMGSRHFAYQGMCPYHKSFEKQCPILRSCPTGACIRDISAEQLFDQFWGWWQSSSTILNRT